MTLYTRDLINQVYTFKLWCAPQLTPGIYIPLPCPALTTFHEAFLNNVEISKSVFRLAPGGFRTIRGFKHLRRKASIFWTTHLSSVPTQPPSKIKMAITRRLNGHQHLKVTITLPPHDHKTEICITNHTKLHIYPSPIFTFYLLPPRLHNHLSWQTSPHSNNYYITSGRSFFKSIALKGSLYVV